jgi:uncharacterized membrane protein YhaH (DUF805 family)
MMKAYLDALRRGFDFGGRTSRAQYWSFILFHFLIAFGLAIVDVIGGTFVDEVGFGLLSGLYSLFMIIPSIAAFTRRLHDVGKSSWWLLLAFIPFGVLFLFYLALKSGDENINTYGAPSQSTLQFA